MTVLSYAILYNDIEMIRKILSLNVSDSYKLQHLKLCTKKLDSDIYHNIISIMLDYIPTISTGLFYHLLTIPNIELKQKIVEKVIRDIDMESIADKIDYYMFTLIMKKGVVLTEQAIVDLISYNVLNLERIKEHNIHIDDIIQTPINHGVSIYLLKIIVQSRALNDEEINYILDLGFTAASEYSAIGIVVYQSFDRHKTVLLRCLLNKSHNENCRIILKQHYRNNDIKEYFKHHRSTHKINPRAMKGLHNVVLKRYLEYDMNPNNTTDDSSLILLYLDLLKDAYSPLDKNIDDRYIESIRLLLEYGADPSYNNNLVNYIVQSLCALDWEYYYDNFMEVLELLLYYGAKPIYDYNKYTTILQSSNTHIVVIDLIDEYKNHPLLSAIHSDDIQETSRLLRSKYSTLYLEDIRSDSIYNIVRWSSKRMRDLVRSLFAEEIVYYIINMKNHQ